MFKIHIILTLFGLIINGSAIRTENCFSKNGHTTVVNGYLGAQNYHLILKCAKEFTDALIDKDHPIRPCIWQDNLKYCSNTVFANVDCRNEVNKLVQFTIEELQNQGKKVPMCFKEDSKTDSKGLGLGYW